MVASWHARKTSCRRLDGFQSPSLRGSGRFRRRRRRTRRRGLLISIPFIAGQWSLPGRAGVGGAPVRIFNPLHCGAVVASRGVGSVPLLPSSVSIPFIAGQWSLLGLTLKETREEDGLNPLHCGAVVASKRPSSRSSSASACLNPLHCGAVVASSVAPARGRSGRAAFQSPSLRGSGRFPPGSRYSSPATSCFNPLHCGAVVASARRNTYPSARIRGFNPLHCGAVVASGSGGVDPARVRRVSIPFIAGQWSLPVHCASATVRCASFQSPSLRGSGRFDLRKGLAATDDRGFNPLHCGAVVASSSACHARHTAIGFNPLHCGAVVASPNRNHRHD